jgi:hypothetical protein
MIVNGQTKQLDQRIPQDRVQLRKAPRARDEILRRIILDDDAMLHHQHPIGNSHRRQPVRDDDGGAVGEQGREALLHESLGMNVERCGRFIRNQHHRIGDECPREREQASRPTDVTSLGENARSDPADVIGIDERRARAPPERRFRL